MEKIKYYFIKEMKQCGFYSLIGKGGKYVDLNDWWDTKEYGFLEKSKVNALLKRCAKTRPYADYGIVERTLLFATKEDKNNFIDRFIRPYEKQQVVNMVFAN